MNRYGAFAFLIAIVIAIFGAANADGSPAPKIESCYDIISAAPVTWTEQRFRPIEFIHHLGLFRITDELDSGQIRVIIQRRRKPWQLFAKGFISRFRKEKILVERTRPQMSEYDRQLAVWQTAGALYTLQMQTWFWSLPKRETPMPTSGLLQIQQLNEQMYMLLDHLPLLTPQKLLPRKVAEKLWRSPRSLQPNLRDYQVWQNQGAQTLSNIIGRRYQSAVVAKYYLEKTKRLVFSALTAYSMCYFAMAVPKLPAACSNFHNTVSNLSRVFQPREEETAFKKDYARRLAFDLAQARELKAKIAAEEKKSNPNQSEIENLKNQLSEYD